MTTGSLQGEFTTEPVPFSHPSLTRQELDLTEKRPEDMRMGDCPRRKVASRF